MILSHVAYRLCNTCSMVYLPFPNTLYKSWVYFLPPTITSQNLPEQFSLNTESQNRGNFLIPFSPNISRRCLQFLHFIRRPLHILCNILPSVACCNMDIYYPRTLFILQFLTVTITVKTITFSVGFSPSRTIVFFY